MLIDDQAVDVKDLSNIWGTEITNPEYNIKINNTLHDKTIIALNNFYLRHRTIISKIWKEDAFTKQYFNFDHDYFKKHRKKYSNAAEKQIDSKDGKSVDPFFNLEYIQFAEFLPKESLYELESQIRKFKDKYISPNNIYFPAIDIVYGDYAKANRYRFDTHLTAFSIDNKSALGTFFSGCDIKMESASLSFVLVSIRFYINEQWKKKISDFAVSGTDDYDRYFHLDRVKIKNVRTLSKGCIGAESFKKYVLSGIYEEIKYRTRKILRQYFEFVTCTMETSSGVFMYFKTNIDKNGSEHFWLSMGVYSFECYLSDEYDACITFIDNNIVCINRFDVKYEYGDIFQQEVANQFNQVTAFSNIKEACNEQISLINKWMHKCEGKNIDLWLQLWQTFNKKNWHIKRFLCEYNMQNRFEWEFMNRRGDYVFSQEDCERTNTETKIMNEDISSIMSAVDKRINAENLVDSNKMQRQTFVTNYASAIFAVIAIVVSIVLNDKAKNVVSDLLSDWPLLPMVLTILLVAIVLWSVIDVIKTLYRWIEKKFIFK